MDSYRNQSAARISIWCLQELMIHLSERIKQVLVVEDDVNNQKAIYELLKHKKIEIHSVYTGKEALEQIQSRSTMIVSFWILSFRI